MSGSEPDPRRANLYLMAVTVFVVFTGFAFLLPFLPLYVRELGVESDEHAVLWSGVLIGASPLLAGLMAPIWGRLADRHGHKRMLVRALAAYVVLLALSAFVRNPAELLLLRAGIGMAGGVGPLSLAMASAQAPRERMGHAVGIMQSAQILAAAAGPLIGGTLADRIGIRATFGVTAGICALAMVLVAWRYVDVAPENPKSPGQKSQTSFFAVLQVPTVPALLLLLFFVNFISRSFTPVLPLHLERIGVAPARLAFSTGLLISVYSIAAAASALSLGALSKRVSPRRLLVLSLAGGAVTVLPMMWVSSFLAFLALAAAFGLLSGGALALGYTVGGLTVSADSRATAFGFLSGAALFGGALSPTVAGVLAQWRLRGIYPVDAALFVALVVLVLVALRDRAPNRPD